MVLCESSVQLIAGCSCTNGTLVCELSVSQLSQF
jgi:hypothetical protein